MVMAYDYGCIDCMRMQGCILSQLNYIQVYYVCMGLLVNQVDTIDTYCVNPVLRCTVEAYCCVGSC